MKNAEQRTVALYASRHPGAPLVVVCTGMGEGRRVFEAARAATRMDFALAAVNLTRWNDELSPWPHPSVFPGGEAFGGGADATLADLTGRLLPEIAAELPGPPAYTAIAGYSLAGLFALYALYQTDVFARAASASGSLWYPGFVDYAKGRAPRRRPEGLSLSLGDREGRTRNPVMRCVELNMRELAQWYRDLGIPTALEMNPGGHFQDEDARLARAIARMLEI